MTVLLNEETAGIEVAVETAVGGGELQYAVIRVGHAARIIFCVTLAPNHLLALGVCQYLHRATQHHALETLGIAEIDAGLGIGLVVGHTQ